MWNQPWGQQLWNRFLPPGNGVYITKQQILSSKEREACPKDKLLQEALKEIGY